MGVEENYNLTPEKKEIFEKFKNRIKNDFGAEEADDSKIYRFLTARDFDFKQAEKMLRNHIEWKKKFKVDTIIEDYEMPEVLTKYARFSVIGFDMEGCPIIFLKFGNLDLKGVFKSLRKVDYLRYVVYYLTTLEKLLQEQSIKLGKPVEKWNVIIDFDRLSLANAINKPAIDGIFEIVLVYEANYPERLKMGYAINVNALFYFIFNIMKTILSAKTLNKINLFGKTGYKEEFLNVIDPTELPAFLGGKKTDPDGNPLCLSIINYGGEIPKQYYLTSNERKLCGQPGVKNYCLHRKGKANISFDVPEPDFSIEWEFEADHNDIAFGLFHVESKDKDKRLKPVVDLQRVDAHLQVETGIYKTERAGNYIFTLDNSYSWLKQKQIFCRVSVISPNGHKTIITV